MNHATLVAGRVDLPTTTKDPADKLKLSVWACASCFKHIQIPLALSDMLHAGELAYVCGADGHRIDLERWKR